MSNVPRYISAHYLYYIDIDLLEEEIDPEDVKDYYIKWHTLHITHMDTSAEWVEEQSIAYGWDNLIPQIEDEEDEA